MAIDFRDEFSRSLTLLFKEAESKNIEIDVEKIQNIFNSILFDRKRGFTLRQFRAFARLYKCKSYVETAEWLSERENKKIQPESVKVRGLRAIDKFISILKEDIFPKNE